MATAEAAAPKKRSLADLEADELALHQLLDDVGGDISDEDAEAAIDAFFAELEQEREKKLMGYANAIRELKARAAAKVAYAKQQKDFVAEVAAGAKRAEGRVQWMEQRLLGYLADRELDELAAGPFTFRRQGVGGMQSLTLLARPEDLPAEYRTEEIVVKADTAAIRAALEAGVELAFARLEPRGSKLAIK